MLGKSEAGVGEKVAKLVVIGGCVDDGRGGCVIGS
jgi:hypothetical protein